MPSKIPVCANCVHVVTGRSKTGKLVLKCKLYPLVKAPTDVKCSEYEKRE